MRQILAFGACCTALAHQVVATPLSSNITSEAYIEVQSNATTWPWRVFKSSPHTPPNMTITGNGGPLAEGYIFMTPQGISDGAPSARENGAFIMTDAGEMVYALPILGVTDFRKQVYDGKDYLTYWSGYSSEGVNTGHGYGETTFLDDKYGSLVVNPDLDLEKLVETENPAWSIDFHEQQMTDRDTLLVTAYNTTPYDLSSVGGSVDGWLVDGLVFELDIASGEVLFSWKATDHLPLNASHQPLDTPFGNGTKADPWDWFHINSIEAVGSDYLINGRHHWACYLVSGEDGSIIWSLEGEHGGSFGALPAEGTFRWQHLARAHNVSESSIDIGIFDNHNSGIDNGTAASRGLVYHLELPPSKSYTPELLRRIETPSEELYAESQGSYDAALSNGNQLLGYGQIPITREYGPATDGSDLRWQAQFGAFNIVQSYRAFKETWAATPADWDPSLVVEDGKAYVSWNGATEVEAWVVYAGATESELTKVGVAEKKGFETVFDVPDGGKSLQVTALQDGEEVRKSNVVATS